MASVKIVDLPLQSYNRKLGHKIGRFTIKSEALAALLLYLKSFQVCFKSHHFIYQITKVSAPFPYPSPTPGESSVIVPTLIFLAKPPIYSVCSKEGHCYWCRRSCLGSPSTSPPLLLHLLSFLPF